MSAAVFDHRISIWRAVEVDDGTATVLGDPVEIGKRWAVPISATVENLLGPFRVFC